jgi:broad specificity phosphatase PhoE
MTSRTAISFVRHGHVHNPKQVYYGRLPGFRLSEEGLRQAQTAAGLLAVQKLSAVFSSPLLRAQQTARIILTAHPSLALRQSKPLLEVHSPWDGHPVSELVKRNWDIYSDSPAGYEQPIDVLNRALKFVTRMRRQYPGQQVLAVTHGDLIAFLFLWARGITVNQQNKQALRPWGLADAYPAPGSIMSLEFNTSSLNEEPGVEYHNDL